MNQITAIGALPGGTFMGPRGYTAAGPLLMAQFGHSVAVINLAELVEAWPSTAQAFLSFDKGAAQIKTAAAMARTIVDVLGFPVTALSDVLDVERKTIYDWWKGAEALSATAERLQTLLKIFEGLADGSLRVLHRFWKRSLSDGATLRDILTSSNLDLTRARQALNELRPVVDAAVKASSARPHESRSVTPAEGLLSGYLEVGSR